MTHAVAHIDNAANTARRAVEDRICIVSSIALSLSRRRGTAAKPPCACSGPVTEPDRLRHASEIRSAQDRVLGSERDQHDDTDLRIEVIVQPEHLEGRHCP